MNTLVWTYNTEITSELFPEYSERDRTTLYINYYRLSIDRASKLGYKCILYTSNSYLNHFRDLDVEIVIIENIDSRLFDFIKIKVLETRSDEYVLIDGDLILNKKLNIPTNVSISYDFLETKSWNMIYSKYVNTLTNLNLNKYIKEWTGVRRSHITNCGLLYFTDSNFKQLYIDRWKLLNNFIKTHIKSTEQINYSATAAQYLLTELIEYYNIESISFKDISDDESYTHYYGDSKFKNPIVPINKVIQFKSNQII